MKTGGRTFGDSAQGSNPSRLFGKDGRRRIARKSDGAGPRGSRAIQSGRSASDCTLLPQARHQGISTPLNELTLVVTTLALHATNSAARIEQMPDSGFIFAAANSFPCRDRKPL
jgi:hypothetical protein